MFLSDWPERLDRFLEFSERDVLGGTGSISRRETDERANSEYAQFEVRRREESELRGAEDALRLIEQETRKRADK